jgi:AcrR family transcriptional regulator
VHETRQRLVTTTAELFRRRGFHGTSVKQVTEAADAPIGSLYHFFPGGKEDLAEAVLLESGEAYRQLFELIADAAPDPATAITDFFDGAAEVLEQSGYVDTCPIGTVALEVASSNDRLRRASDRVFRSWIDAAAARFTAVGIPADEAEALAATAVAALEGAFMLARSRQDPAPLRTAGRHIRQLVEAAVATAGAAGATSPAGSAPQPGGRAPAARPRRARRLP